MKQFIVKQYADTLDTNPVISRPMEEWEAFDVKYEWVCNTMEHIVQHSPYMIGEAEYDELYEHELSLIVIEEVTP